MLVFHFYEIRYEAIESSTNLEGKQHQNVDIYHVTLK